jgi:hypothetical protein
VQEISAGAVMLSGGAFQVAVQEEGLIAAEAFSKQCDALGNLEDSVPDTLTGLDRALVVSSELKKMHEGLTRDANALVGGAGTALHKSYEEISDLADERARFAHKVVSLTASFLDAYEWSYGLAEDVDASAELMAGMLDEIQLHFEKGNTLGVSEILDAMLAQFEKLQAGFDRISMKLLVGSFAGVVKLGDVKIVMSIDSCACSNWRNLQNLFQRMPSTL